MKMAIISDTHDNISNLEKLFRILKKKEIHTIIHAGDLSAPSLIPKTIAPNFQGKMYLIFGNVGDKELLPEIVSQFPNIKYLGEEATLQLDNKKICVIHKPDKLEEKITVGFDLIIYGHTHQSEIRKSGDTLIVNPGTLAGLYNKATFAIYNTSDNKVEIENLI